MRAIVRLLHGRRRGRRQRDEEPNRSNIVKTRRKQEKNSFFNGDGARGRLADIVHAYAGADDVPIARALDQPVGPVPPWIGPLVRTARAISLGLAQVLPTIEPSGVPSIYPTEIFQFAAGNRSKPNLVENSKKKIHSRAGQPTWPPTLPPTVTPTLPPSSVPTAPPTGSPSMEPTFNFDGYNVTNWPSAFFVSRRMPTEDAEDLCRSKGT